MKSFWADIYDAVKDRNYGILFFTTFLGLIIGFCIIGLIVAIVGPVAAESYLVPTLAGFGCFTVVAALISIRRAWRRRVERSNVGVLSRDEIHKARSKLMRSKLKL